MDIKYQVSKRKPNIITRRQFLKKVWFFLLTLGGFMAIYRYYRYFGQTSIRHLLNKNNEDLHEAMYYKKLDGNKVKCEICFRRCVVSNGQRGFCRNKINRDGKYYTLVYNKPCSLQIDPIEKEPAYHMLPGGTIFCIATVSCNNRCKFCHNWHISQKSVEETHNYYLTPPEVVDMAIKKGCDALSFTYSEPTVFYEYMFDIVKLAKKTKLKTLYHTNGLINEEPLAALLKYMDAVTVDLKAFTSEFYQKVCSSKLEPALTTLKNIKKAGIHLEIVNLIIPTLNDDMGDIRKMCVWIKENLGKDVPLHFSRFFPAYRLTTLSPTPIHTLEKAKGIADEAGLHYVSIGNVPGHKFNSTFCPQCKKVLIRRIHFDVLENNVKNGKCKFCGYKIHGIWR